jgi:uncharacterized membrane protein (UPF0127 family)
VSPTPLRWRHAPLTTIAGRRVRRAERFPARLLGLALLPAERAERGLLLPGTRAVHTFGMRFPLDLIWLAADGSVIRTDLGVPPRRLRSCPHARSVIELPERPEPARGPAPKTDD